MAKSANKVTREPGRVRQLLKIYAVTAKTDKSAVALAAVGFIVPILLGIAIASVIAPGSPIGMTLWGILGGLAGVLIAMVIMSRRAEAAAYARFEGQPGAAGAVLNAALRRGWRFSEMPVHVSPKTQEMVYRAVGPGGVVLIGEGSSRARVQAMVEDERRKVSRIAPGVGTHAFYVIPGDEKSVPLAKLGRTILKLKRTLNRGEVSVVANRLDSIGLNIPVPKGIDPSRMRAQRR
jgi:F0F1-type ATP synthase assembly protein I